MHKDTKQYQEPTEFKKHAFVTKAINTVLYFLQNCLETTRVSSVTIQGKCYRKITEGCYNVREETLEAQGRLQILKNKNLASRVSPITYATHFLPWKM